MAHNARKPAVCGALQQSATSCVSEEQWSRGESNPRADSTKHFDNSGFASKANQGGAESGAVDTEKAPIDPDLARLINAWPNLPEAIRAGIVAMVNAAIQSR